MTEFTCDNGQCVSIYYRCDNSYQCFDKSDERECHQFLLSRPYYREIPPSVRDPITGKLHTKLNISIKVLVIDKVDFVNSLTEITYIITIYWKDSKVSYLNLIDNSIVEYSVKDLTSAENVIWNPLEKLIHSNSIVGSIITEEDSKELSVTVHNEIDPFDPGNSFEEAIYKGVTGKLAIHMKQRGTFDCTFDLFRFPFNHQTCAYKFKLKDVSDRHIVFVSSNNSVTYSGVRILENFEVVRWFSCSRDLKNGSEFSFYIMFHYLYYQGN